MPTAWRGLGGEDHGPARPVDAQLPRRFGEGYDERVRRVEAERVTRRRTGMLIALAVALGLFVLAQAWVAGRAAPAFDAGLHRFRDADFGAAQRVWTQLAGAGDANAQFMLGYLSEAGLGRPWSARAAAAWYRLAADAGHAEAQWRLGLLYDMGLGVPYEPAAALRWWAAAASGGHGEAAYRLARARLEGAAGPTDVDGALAAFERAFDLGWPAARPYRDALLVASSGRPHPGALP
ncbi:MAG: sel1 repeat family protein [Trueperaceae bacterium]|nr:MAG: sel1 repeat family protein [Trueperaceae bacterium]